MDEELKEQVDTLNKRIKKLECQLNDLYSCVSTIQAMCVEIKKRTVRNDSL